MKKGILLIGVLAMTASVFAQQQAGWMSASNAEVAAAWGWGEIEGKMGWLKDKVSRPAGTLIAETESVVLRTAFVDDCTGSSINKLSLTYYSVNGVDYKSEGPENNVWQGAVGNTNPKALNLEDIQITTGWVLDYEVKADGYLTVLSQASLNKNLYVIEGAMSDEGVVPNGAVAYDFYVVCASQPEGLEGTQFSYKLPADKDGYLDMAAAGAYVDGGTIMWPYRIFMGDATVETSDKKYPNTNAATVFPVYEGCHYYFFCTGSKVTAGPYIFTKEYPKSVSFSKDIKDEEGNVTSTEVYNLIGEGDAVEAVAVENVDAPIYNMMGVRVNADAKGILIQNGQKFIRK